MTTTLKRYEPGSLYQVNPGDLVLERNIRDAHADADLLASVKALGVLQPVTAVVNSAGQLVVRLGHRRTLAALEAGRDRIPVYVAGADDTADAAEIDRIVSQYDENTQRAGLTHADELGVVEQLTAFGLTAAQIAKRTRVKRDLVDIAMTVSASAIAREAAAEIPDLTLDQAAVLAEFEDDPEIVEKLTEAAIDEPASFDHVAQRARDEALRQRHADRLRAELEAAGVTVLDEEPNHQDRTKRLYRLRDTDGKEITEDAHQSCPGHVAWLRGDWQWIDADGELLGPDADVDAPGVRELIMPEVEYGCADFRTYGHTDAWASSTPKPKAADMTDERREAARKERQLVIENNKAWDAATVVRRGWLQLLAKFKTPPKGTAAFIAAALALDGQVLTDYRVTGVTAEVFAAPLGQLRGTVTKALKGASDGRAQVIALAQVLAAYEATLTRDSWRGDGKTNACGRYLQFIELAGYQLSDVERFALSSRTV